MIDDFIHESDIVCLICKNSENLKLWSQATDEEYFTTNKLFKYFYCGSCNNISIAPVPEKLLNIIYPKNYYSYSVSVKGSILENVKQYFDKKFFYSVLKKIQSKDISVLDVGGGSGWLLSLIKKFDKRVKYTQVVDLDEKAEDLARSNGHEFYLGAIENYTTERKFDLILMMNILEHVKDPQNVLGKVKKLLSDEGVILIKTPNWASLDAKIFKKHYWGGLHAPRHWVIFCEESLFALAKDLKLKVSLFKYTQGAPFWAFSIMQLLKKYKVINPLNDRPIIYSKLTKYLMGVFAIFDFMRMPFMKTSQMFFILSNEK